MVTVPGQPRDEDDAPTFDGSIGWARTASDLLSQVAFIDQRRRANASQPVLDPLPVRKTREQWEREHDARVEAEAKGIRAARGITGDYEAELALAREEPKQSSEAFKRERGLVGKPRKSNGRENRPSRTYDGRRNAHIAKKAARLGISFEAAEALTPRREPVDREAAYKARLRRRA